MRKSTLAQQLEIDHLKGENAALGAILLAMVLCLPEDVRQRVLQHVEAGLEGGRTELLNSPDSTDAELNGYNQVCGALKYALAQPGS